MTRMPVPASSRRNEAVLALSADLAALYGAMNGTGKTTANEVMLIMRPVCRARIVGKAHWMSCSGA